MNKLYDFTEFNKRRRKDAERNPLFNLGSTRWVATVVQNCEVVVIRQNNQHGFISLGWDDPDEKIILFTKDYDDGRAPKWLWKKMISLSELMAKHLNKLERN